jgi:outer membrane protein TolC
MKMKDRVTCETDLGGNTSPAHSSALWASGLVVVALCLIVGEAAGQSQAASGNDAPTVSLQQLSGPGQVEPPLTITLQDALERARKNDAQFLGSATDAKIAHEDVTQARNAMLPSVNNSTQYLGTQGNGTPEGRFVTNDGVHVYREWAVVHQDLSPSTYMLTGYHRAAAAAALAKAKAEIAQRGLVVIVTRNYYALAAAQRKYSTAQQAVGLTKRFLGYTQEAEHAGQAAHSDAIKAEIQNDQQQQAFEEAGLAMENARLDLAVLLFPTLSENFSVVDDLDSPQALPPFPEAEAMAGKENPDLRVALEAAHEADLDVAAAKGAFLPSLSVDLDYGIEANNFAFRSVAKAHPELGPLPNLGYFVTASLTIPVWDWGTLRSRLHQSEYRQQQAQAELSQAQRQLLSNLYAYYNEASVARAAVGNSRHTADLAAESYRLINLRYQAGESTALEMVDAENTLTQARNTFDDEQVRYRVALANLQTITGNF